MNRSIAWTLRIGIIVGLILIVIGEFMDEGNPFLEYGILVLICSPLLALFAAVAGLVSERDWFWAAMAALVIIIVVGGACIAMM
jgi:uncharacterized membrane protein